MKYKKNIILGVVLLAVFLIIITLSNSTYALFSNDAYGENTNNFSTGMLSIEAHSKSENISLSNVLPISDSEGLAYEPYVFTIKNYGNLDYLFDVKLLSTGDSSTTFSPQYIKMQIDNGDIVTLSSLTNGEIKSDVTLLAGESIDVTIRLWLDIETPNSELGKSFTSKIVIDGQAVYTSSNKELTVTGAQLITDLYNNSDKTVVTNNGIEYNYAPAVDLMNDRLGGTTSDYNGGNIRYYGSSPNNYIYFNCSDYSNQNDDNCEKWRILGVFDGKVKIIKPDTIGYYTWDLYWVGDEPRGNNNWSTSSLNSYLNGDYYNSLRAKNNTTIDLISKTTYYLGGFNTTNLYSDEIYNYERTNEVGTTIYSGNPFSVDTNIGIIYASDYGYATDFNQCSSTLDNFSGTTNYDGDFLCRENWIFSNMSENDDSIWLINPNVNGGIYVWYIAPSGDVFSDVGGEVLLTQGVFPVLYLDKTLTFSGDGSSSNPYQINLKQPTSISNFDYVLGSETPILYEYYLDGNNLYFPGIELAENDILLLKYNGDSKNVVIPDTYEIDGNIYNVIALSTYYTIFYDDNDDPINFYTGLFYENNSIETVFFGNNVRVLHADDGEYKYADALLMFYNCVNLKHVNLPNDITELNSTFYGCISLINVPEIPGSIANMMNTFNGCTSLTGTVKIKSSRVYLLSGIFSGTNKPITVEVPAGSATYTSISKLTTSNGMPSNVTLRTFTAN